VNPPLQPEARHRYQPEAGLLADPIDGPVQVQQLPPNRGIPFVLKHAEFPGHVFG
jgi:hypothetical protein